MCIRDSFMVDWFNACFRFAYFPLKWRQATVTMIPKPCKTPCSPTNFGPSAFCQPCRNFSNDWYSGECKIRIRISRWHSWMHQLIRFVETVAEAGC